MEVDIRPGMSMWLGGVGVELKVLAEQTGGAFSVVEHPVLPGALVPPHLHRAEDELSIVLEGRIGVRIGDTVRDAGTGDYVFKPRNVPHAFWNATNEPARLIEVIWPGGFERFFVELAAAFADGAGEPAPDRVAELGARYGNEFVMEWVPELEATYGISVLHGGGR